MSDADKRFAYLSAEVIKLQRQVNLLVSAIAPLRELAELQSARIEQLEKRVRIIDQTQDEMIERM